jgi:hypothetical protein
VLVKVKAIERNREANTRASSRFLSSPMFMWKGLSALIFYFEFSFNSGALLVSHSVTETPQLELLPYPTLAFFFSS